MLPTFIEISLFISWLCIAPVLFIITYRIYIYRLAKRWLSQHERTFIAWYVYNADEEQVIRLAFDHHSLDRKFQSIIVSTYLYNDNDFYFIAYGFDNRIPNNASLKVALSKRLIRQYGKHKSTCYQLIHTGIKGHWTGRTVPFNESYEIEDFKARVELEKITAIQ